MDTWQGGGADTLVGLELRPILLFPSPCPAAFHGFPITLTPSAMSLVN